MIASFASTYLCQMLNFGIDGEEMPDKLILMHG